MAGEDISQFPKHRNTGIRLIMLDLQGVSYTATFSFICRTLRRQYNYQFPLKEARRHRALPINLDQNNWSVMKSYVLTDWLLWFVVTSLFIEKRRERWVWWVCFSVCEPLIVPSAASTNHLFLYTLRPWTGHLHPFWTKYFVLRIHHFLG